MSLRAGVRPPQLQPGLELVEEARLPGGSRKDGSRRLADGPCAAIRALDNS